MIAFLLQEFWTYFLKKNTEKMCKTIKIFFLLFLQINWTNKSFSVIFEYLLYIEENSVDSFSFTDFWHTFL